MAKACQTCGGRGIRQVLETYSDGDQMIMWYECNDCHGTGEAPDLDEDGTPIEPDDVFSLDGDDEDE